MSWRMLHRNCTLVLADWPSFRAKRLHFVAPRWDGSRPKEKEEKEGLKERERGRKKDRGGEGKGEREGGCEDVKVICHDEKM